MSLRLACAALAVTAFAIVPATTAVAASTDAAVVHTAQSGAAVTEADVQRASEVFSARMDQLKADLVVAIGDNTTDTAAMMARVNPVIAQYQPDIDAFSAVMAGFFDTQIAEAQPDTRQQVVAAKAQVLALLQGMPDEIRASVLASASGTN